MERGSGPSDIEEVPIKPTGRDQFKPKETNSTKCYSNFSSSLANSASECHSELPRDPSGPSLAG